MDFDLTEEQRLLKESLDRLLGDHYAFEQRKSYAQAPEGWSRELWATYAELGLLGLLFAEEYGGSAGGPVETMIAMDGFGRALALEPFLATVVLGGGFLRNGGSAEQCAELVPRMACCRSTPPMAAHPAPGCRLLHGQEVSRKYSQRVRCRTLPPMVATLRICRVAASARVS